MTATLSADHRAVDGADAARFLETFKSALEDPRDGSSQRDDPKEASRDSERARSKRWRERAPAAWLRAMLEIRLFEEKVQELFMQGQIQGTTHLCQGQEAVSVGAVGALEDRRLPDDHLPRPRPRARPRHADGGGLRRADGADERLLRGRRRLDAPDRLLAQPDRRVRDHRRRASRSAVGAAMSAKLRGTRLRSRWRSAATARRTSAPSTRR